MATTFCPTNRQTPNFRPVKPDLLPEIEKDPYMVENPNDTKALIVITLMAAAMVGLAAKAWDIYQNKLDEIRNWTVKEKSVFYVCLLVKIACAGVVANAVQEYRQETGMVEEECKLIIDETGAVVDQVCEIVD